MAIRRGLAGRIAYSTLLHEMSRGAADSVAYVLRRAAYARKPHCPPSGEVVLMGAFNSGFGRIAVGHAVQSQVNQAADAGSRQRFPIT